VIEFRAPVPVRPLLPSTGAGRNGAREIFMSRETELGRGVLVFLVLAVLTGIEYAIAILTQAYGALVALALLKALLVLQFFMHVSRVTSGEGGHS